MKRNLQLASLLLAIIPSTAAAQSVQAEFDRMLDSINDALQGDVGILIHVESPDKNISWTRAVGFSDSSGTVPLKQGQPVLVASNTKTYVSAAILRLVEDSVIELDEPIGDLLKENTRTLLEQDEYDLRQITIKHLLSHTSGIHDYVDKAYFDFVMENQQYQWTRDEQIQRSVDIGQPLAMPGTSFSYGDVNYLLLTEIIEKQTQKPFFEAMRELLKYEELGLNSTWFKDLEPKPEGVLALAHQYAKDFQMDSYNVNPSWDLHGGGGIAATVKDAALFFQYLFEGKVIKNDAVLEAMYSYVLPEDSSTYCLGVYHFDIGVDIYYHGGWWGTDLSYSPQTNSSVAVFTLVKELRTEINPFLGKAIQRLLD